MDNKTNQQPAAGPGARNHQPTDTATTSSQPQASLEQPSTEAGILNSALESGKSALESGKKWIADSGAQDAVSQVPQQVKNWSSKTAARVSSLSTTQKVVGGAILAAGLGWLALRKGKSAGSEAKPSVYGRQGRTGSSYGRQQGSQSSASEDYGRRASSEARSSMPSFGGSKGISPTSYGSVPASDHSSRNSESSSGHSTGSSYGSSTEDSSY